MIKNEDIKNIYKYFKGESVDTKEIEKLTQKLELIVEQIEIQEDFNKKMDEVSKKFEKIK